MDVATARKALKSFLQSLPLSGLFPFSRQNLLENFGCVETHVDYQQRMSEEKDATISRLEREFRNVRTELEDTDRILQHTLDAGRDRAKKLNEQGELITDLTQRFNICNGNLHRANQDLTLKESDNGKLRQQVMKEHASYMAALAQLEEVKRAGRVSDQFRSNAQMRQYENSYTKRVVDELKRLFPISTNVAHRGDPTSNALQAAIVLLEDYHATQHHIYVARDAALAAQKLAEADAQKARESYSRNLISRLHDEIRAAKVLLRDEHQARIGAEKTLRAYKDSVQTRLFDHVRSRILRLRDKLGVTKVREWFYAATGRNKLGEVPVDGNAGLWCLLRDVESILIGYERPSLNNINESTCWAGSASAPRVAVEGDIGQLNPITILLKNVRFTGGFDSGFQFEGNVAATDTSIPPGPSLKQLIDLQNINTLRNRAVSALSAWKAGDNSAWNAVFSLENLIAAKHGFDATRYNK